MNANVSNEVISNFLKYTSPADMSPDGGLSFSKGPHPVTGNNLVHKEENGAIVTYYGNDWKFVNGPDAETEEDASYGFSDGDEPNNAVNDLNSFVGICFHLIQQTGGELYYKNKQVKAVNLNDTSGEPVKASTQISLGGNKVQFKDVASTNNESSTGTNLLIAQQVREMFENVLTYVPKEAAKPVTEADEAIVDGWYTRDVQSLDMFMQQLDKDYEHDYGTICHAVAAMAVQAAKLMNKQDQGGITGFQAGAVMWQFISKWMHIKGPMKLVKFEDMLYPQYAERFEKTIGKDTWQFLQTKAMENLINSPDVHPKVVAHWKSVVDGVVPFGYTVQGE